MTQHEKIIKMCRDEKFHCQNEFRALFIFSPHKRRSEIEIRGQYSFEKQKCEHGVRGQFDYKMIDNYAEPPPPPRPVESPEFNQIRMFV